MFVRCVIARDLPGADVPEHVEHLLVTVPRSGENVSLLVDGKPELFRVTGVIHCVAGLFGEGSDPIVNLTVARSRQACPA